jgi:hypothetical protein
MAVKTYDTTALVQRMTDVYVDTVRYHNSHWQVLGASIDSFGTQTGAPAATWANVPDDTIFITNMYRFLLNRLISHERNATMLTALQGLTAAAFITAAQSQFTV